MTRLFAFVRALYRGVVRSSDLDLEMQDEMRFHIDMESERLMRDHGLTSAEARRRALVAFGGMEKYKQSGRDARVTRWLEALWLDLRLGVRMLVKHPGLTLVGGFAIVVAMTIGATAFETLGELVGARLPFAGGDRLVSIQVPASDGRIERRVVRDFADLRGALRSIEHIGVFRTIQQNLVSADAPPEPIRLAEMSASGFVIAQTPPLLGRYLIADDERPGAAAVVVIGYRAWQTRFAADPEIVGRVIDLAGVSHAIVGVMPAGFGFPVNHDFWVPFRSKPLEYSRREGPLVFMFGRLATGATIEQAQAEIETAGHNLAIVHPQTHDLLFPRVLPYTREHVDLSHPTLVMMVRLAQLLVGVLTFVVAVNIAILLYARTVTRLGEIAVRTALGASRVRVLAQLFNEALALSLGGAVIGLMLSSIALRYVQSLAEANGSVPYWIRFELSPPTIAYALLLAVMAAAIMGIVPGLKATGRRFATTMHELTGRTGTRLGPMWTTLVVAQVAVAVAVLPLSAYLAWQIVRMEVAGPGFAADRFMVSTVVIGDERAVDADDVRGRKLELMSRLQSEPGVTGVTFSSAVPGFAGAREFEFDERVQARGQGTFDASVLDISPDFFATYEAELVAGRGLDGRDVGAAGPVVVNQTFVNVYLEGRNPIGVRLRYVARSSAPKTELWHDIVGVVRDFPSFPPSLSIDGEPAVYHASDLGPVEPFVASVRFAGTLPSGIAERMRIIGAEVDPSIQLRRVTPLARYYDDVRSYWRYLSWGITLVTASVLLLSAAGIYAMMSFTIVRRTREIGIRTALGAHPRRVLLGIFGRAASQLLAGVVAGSLLSGLAAAVAGLGVTVAAALVGTVALIMLMVGLLAAWGPARRGLRIQASEALRTEA